jgi:hypothetical protein
MSLEPLLALQRLFLLTLAAWAGIRYGSRG